MTTEQTYLIHLLKSAVFEQYPPSPPQEIKWNSLFNLAFEQKVHTIIFTAVDKLPENQRPGKKLMELWRVLVMDCVFQFARHNAQIAKISEHLKQNGIEALILKGMILRELYPIPELRTMSDCDIVIHENQNDDFRRLIENDGYSIHFVSDRVRSTYVTNYVKEGHFKLEVFNYLFGGMKINDGFDLDLWLNAKPFENEYVKMMSPENNFIHLIAHLAKHVRGRGAGIRNLLDIAIYINKYAADMDWKYILKYIRLLNAERFLYGVLQAAEKCFDAKVPVEYEKQDDNIVNLMIKYMLSHGVYGDTRNAHSDIFKDSEIKKTNRFTEYLKLVFISPDKLSKQYSYAKRHKLLLPIAWICRWYRAIFVKKYSIRQEFHNMLSAPNLTADQTMLIKYFELDYDIPKPEITL